MGFFDRFLSSFRSRSVADILALPEKVVPAGHVVKFFLPMPYPGFRRTEGGVLIADLGLGGDERPAKVDEVLDHLEMEIASSNSLALIPAEKVNLSGVFAPNRVQTHSKLQIVLCLGGDSLAHWFREKARGRVLLERLQHLGAGRGSKVAKMAYLQEQGSPAAHLMQEVLQSAGFEVRRPDEQGAVVEVTRPEGIRISAPLGEPLNTGAALRPQEAKGATSNNLLERAAELFRVEDRPLDIAPYLRRLLLETLEGKENELEQEVLARTWPFLLLVDPLDRGLIVQRWGEHSALGAFADLQSVQWAAHDLGLTSAPIGIMSARDLLRTAAVNQNGIALNVYRDRNSPHYVLWDAQKVLALSSASGG